MKLQDVDDDLPILLFYYEQVVQKLETVTTTNPRKISRTAALDHFLQTRSFKETAKHFDVSATTINGIVSRAFRVARRMAGITRDWRDEDENED